MSRRNKEVENLLAKSGDQGSDRLVLNEQEELFCRWYCGLEETEDGITTTIDPYLSAIKSGFTESESKRAKFMIRDDLRIMRYISFLNNNHKKSVLLKVDHYVENGIESMNNIINSGAKDTSRIAAFRVLRDMSGYGAIAQKVLPSGGGEDEEESYSEKLKALKETFTDVPVIVHPNSNINEIVNNRPPEIIVETKDGLVEPPED